MKKTQKNTRKYLYLLLVAVSCFAAWLADLIAPPQPVTVPKTPSGFSKDLPVQSINLIGNVIDGDTLKIPGQSIRLLYIDAPETAQKCLDREFNEYDCGQVSTEFLKKLVQNKNLRCQYQEKDIYQRILAVCYLGEININYELIKNGMAIIYDESQAGEELKELQASAKTNKSGVWQGPFQEPKEFRKKNKKRKK